VIFSGAGLSAESGVPTFRDSNGLWENHKVEDVASQDGWKRDKQTVLKFYDARFHGIKAVQPNDAHKAIARLQEKFNVINVTQNIDDLLERAGCTNVRHLHGIITRRKCEWHKDISNLDGDMNFVCDYKEDQTSPVTLGEMCPFCPEAGRVGQLRPDVVWFGEAVDLPYNYMADLCREVKYNNGVFICVGTSAQVYPAAYLVSFFSQVKNKYIVDKKPIKVSDYTLLEGSAGEQMTKLADKLLAD
jgi:NAD-dependent deacetylase